MRERAGILFPVLPIEGFERNIAERGLIHAAKINADTIRIGSRHIEWLNATGFAEIVFRNTGVKGIKRQLLPISQQLKSGSRNDKMLKADPIADRTITLVNFDIGFRFKFKLDPPTVAVPFVNDRHH